MIHSFLKLYIQYPQVQHCIKEDSSLHCLTPHIHTLSVKMNSISNVLYTQTHAVTFFLFSFIHWRCPRFGLLLLARFLLGLTHLHKLPLGLQELCTCEYVSICMCLVESGLSWLTFDFSLINNTHLLGSQEDESISIFPDICLFTV